MTFSSWLQRQATKDPGAKGWRDGTERLIEPGETVRRLKPRMAELGITRLADLTGLDRIGIPVIMCCRPNARSVAISMGKGLDRDAALASALMESIEGWHAEFAELPLRWATFRDLAPCSSLINIKNLPMMPGQHFDPDRALLWTEAVNILDDTSLWLPLEIAHADYRVPGPPGTGCLMLSTNGLASGNHLLEAILHAIFEVVERDGTYRFWQLSAEERLARRIDLRTVDDPGCVEMIHRMQSAGLDVAVWQTVPTVDLPAYFCLIAAPDGENAHPALGAGCHSQPAIALARALSEAAQVRMTYISGARDDLYHREFGRDVMLSAHRRFRAIMSGEPCRAMATQVFCPTCFADDLQQVLDKIVDAGLEQVALVDFSGPIEGVHVARIVMPGQALQDDDR